VEQVSLPLPLTRPLADARTWWGSLRLAAHCALGALVATQSDLAQVWRLSLVPLAFGLGGMVLVALLRTPARRERAAGLALLAASLFVLSRGRAPGLLLALYLGTVVVALSLTAPLPRLLPASTGRAAAFALGHGVLPFLAGYAASGHRPGASAWLLALGFFALCVGGYPYLRRGAWDESLAPAWFDRVSLAGFIVGVAATGTWLMTYGAGISGLLLATPSALWLLWLAAGGAQRTAGAAWHPRRQALAAWLTLQAAIALAGYF